MTLPSLSRFPDRSFEFAARRAARKSATPFHAAARLLLVVTICAAPWAFGAVQPWGWGGLAVLSLAALVLWAVGCMYCGLLRVTWSPIYWPFLAFLSIACLQLFAGLTVDRIATREAVLKLATNFIFFFLAGQLLNSQPENGRWLKRWGFITAIEAFALSALAMAQIMTSSHGLIYWTVKTTYGPYGPYVSYNDYCGLMEMLIPVAVGYILSRSSDRLSRAALWLGVGMALASVWISGSRGGTAVTLVEAVIFGLIILRYWKEGPWRRALPFITGLILTSAAIFVFVGSGRVSERGWTIFRTDKSFEVKLGDRLWVAEDTLRMARSHPWLGVGVGGFETAFPAYASHPTDLHWTHAHNDYAEALAETGLVGGLVILWGLVVFFRLAFRDFSKTLRMDWGWIRVGALVGLLGLGVHSMVDFNLRIAANAAWFVVCLAIVTQPYSLTEHTHMVISDAIWRRSRRFVN